MSPEIPDEKPIVLFDGVCNRCNGFLQFILPRDTDGKIQFASLQSDIGQELLEAHDLPTDTLESIVLIEGDDCYGKSGAVARIAAHLGGGSALAPSFRYLPRPIRDRAYDFVAGRYRWFEQQDPCLMSTGDVRSRVLE